MKYDPVLAAMLAEPWSNNACRGYVIYAMENCGFAPDDIRRVVGELHYVFDLKSCNINLSLVKSIKPFCHNAFTVSLV